MVYSYAIEDKKIMTCTLLNHCHAFFLLGRGIPTRRAFFGEGRGPVHLSRAECTSQDMDLLKCTIDKSAVNGCDHSEDAGVICRGVFIMIVYARYNIIICRHCMCVCVCMSLAIYWISIA